MIKRFANWNASALERRAARIRNHPYRHAFWVVAGMGLSTLSRHYQEHPETRERHIDAVVDFVDPLYVKYVRPIAKRFR